MTRTDSIETPLWRDAHLHLRQGQATKELGPYSAAWCSDVVIMPNTQPAIASASLLQDYEADCRQALGDRCRPLMTAYLTKTMTMTDIYQLKKAGCVAIKIYPEDQTTNSHDGLSRDDYLEPSRRLRDLLATAQALDLAVLWHGEVPGDEIQIQEAVFCDTFMKVAGDFPKLRMVMEHISTAEGIETIKALCAKGLPVAGTITMHHPWFTDGLTSVMRPKCKPDWICMPLAKRRHDTVALIGAMAHNAFFLGTDSAPHLPESKYAPEVCAGCFTAPHPEMLVQTMEDAGLLDHLVAFTSERMGHFYRLDQPLGKLTWTRKSWQVPRDCSGYVPFLAGMELRWSLG